MNRIDRLMGLITVLQSRKYVLPEKIAEKFGMSVRTVYRDVKALNEIGVPVGFEPNKGYHIAQGFFLPPLLFTTEEANALILLQTLANRFTDQSIARHSTSALNKIKAVLRSYDKEMADQMSTQINIYVPEDEKAAAAHLATLQQAIAQKHILHIKYADNKGAHTERDIEPVGLVFYTFQWHLIAWCWLRNEYRDFKVKTIVKLTNSGKPFRKEHAFKAEEYLKFFSQR
ncbi:YafY family protein [Paraflavitalea sp. CAU 1676]|uniref:helix-turn-helix transcriptional regulator n=1 Tax=Paraflavitalea sp. CAU 1676 TaxID=3032598 RepID=UPI0023D9B72A|nr:YafY family protein [Paraflavitalea sp. CAU 1676]MDF2193315.1 YafY family protein [Paraflavitalea sp. CAU 1676]